MNYSRILALALLTIVSLSGCETFLEETPQQNIPTEGAISDPFTANAAMLGIYNQLSSANLYGCNIIMVSELMGTNAIWGGSFANFRDIANRTMLSNNATPAGLYTSGYGTITNANFLINEFAKGVPGLSSEDSARYVGECLWARGMVLFDMVRYFAQPYGFTADNSHLGVPVVRGFAETIDDLNGRPSRATVQQVYDSVIVDLEAAIALLPESVAEVGGYGIRATANTARGILMRVYLQQDDYASCAALCEDIILSGEYQLNATPDIFYLSKNSSESMYEVQFNNQDNPGVNASLTAFATPSGSDGRAGRGDLRVSTTSDASVVPNRLRLAFRSGPGVVGTSSTTLFQAGDLRIGLLLAAPVNNRLHTAKYFRDADLSDNIPVLRYAEVLITYAECLNELGDQANAQIYLNEIRNRAGLADWAGATDQVSLRTEILNERRRELNFEGDDFHVLMRTSQPSIRSVSFGSSSLIWPIPQAEIDVNPNLVQNPGY